MAEIFFFTFFYTFRAVIAVMMTCQNISVYVWSCL